MTRIPEFASGIFTGREDFRYWIGAVATSDDRVLLPNEYKAARVLRANSYIDVHRYLPEHARRVDGQEIDADDSRATHHVVLEQLDAGRVRLIGTGRLIDRRRGMLPCERFFPEDFPRLPDDAPVLERSRVIAASGGGAVLGALTRASLLFSRSNGIDHTFGLMEPWLLARFRDAGTVIEALSQPRMIEHYNSENVLTRGDAVATIERVTAGDADFALTPYFRAAGAVAAGGLGYAREDDLIVVEP
jgi:N-acyl-L-homoserine lactone synthetase